MSRRKLHPGQQETSHKISRAAALLELNGEAVMLKLSVDAWSAVLAIATKDGGGQLVVAKVPNQAIFDGIDLPELNNIQNKLS